MSLRLVSRICCSLLYAVVNGVTSAQELETSGRIQGKQHGLRFHVSARMPDQIAAFYEGRGFPRGAIEVMLKACFVTVGLRNDRRDIVWLELDRWRFVTVDGTQVSRFDRNHWNNKWKKLALPLGNQATFDWTQLPETRDLHPDEPVGGNVTLAPPPGPFALEARFRTGADKLGKELVIQVSGLTCPGRKANTK